MLPFILGGAALLAWHHFHKHATPALLTPPRAAVHGHLMQNEIRPDKLEKMASLFGEEGLDEHAKMLAAKAREVRKQAQGAKALIERARTGDQNAMGLIAAVRENAKNGDPRARTSCQLMLKYCEQFPMQSLGPLGELPVEDAGQAFQEAIAHGQITSPFGCS